MKKIISLITLALFLLAAFFAGRSPLNRTNEPLTKEEIESIYNIASPEIDLKKKNKKPVVIYIKECGISVTFPIDPIFMSVRNNHMYMAELPEDIALALTYDNTSYGNYKTDGLRKYQIRRNEFLNSKYSPRKLISELKLDIPNYLAHQLTLKELSNGGISHLILMENYKCHVLLSSSSSIEEKGSEHINNFFESVSFDNLTIKLRSPAKNAALDRQKAAATY